MLIYHDLFTGEELCSDSYALKPFNDERDEVLLRFKGKYGTRTEDGNYDTGANASAEETQQEVPEDGSVSGVDIILNHNLTLTQLNRKQYGDILKVYTKRLLKKLAESYKSGKDLDKIFGTLRADTWEDTEAILKKAYMSVATTLLKLVKDEELTFFMTPSFSDDAMIVLVQYEGETPDVILWKHGVTETKQ